MLPPPQVPRADTPSPQPPCGSGWSQIPQSAGGVRPTDYNLYPTKRGVSSRPAGNLVPASKGLERLSYFLITPVPFVIFNCPAALFLPNSSPPSFFLHVTYIILFSLHGLSPPCITYPVYTTITLHIASNLKLDMQFLHESFG